MKKLGLVGGMGPESTIPYYHDLVYGVQRRLGTDAFPAMTIESVDVYQVLGLCGQKKYGELTEYLLRAVRNLAVAGADFGALSANTPHIVFDELKAASPIPLVSILDTTVAEAQRRGYTRLGLMGTAFTMDGTFFHRPFERAGIALVTPSGKEKTLVHEKISVELEKGIVKPETQAHFLALTEKMRREEGIEALILGCTELPLVFQGMTAPVPLLDTMQIHIAALVDEILSD